MDLTDEDLANLTPEQLLQLDALIEAAGVVWAPQEGPQTAARASEADIIGFGGAAGGGKSDLGIGTAILDHQRVLMLRREKAQTEGLVQRIAEIVGSTDGYSSQKSAWRVPAGKGPLIEFGGLDDLGDERKWQGRSHDLILVDEATECREAQVRFVFGWNRSNDPEQRSRGILTFNPPTSAEGRWVLKFFALWLDRKHPNPAKPGEIRWFTTIGNNPDTEVPDSRPFVLGGDKTKREEDRPRVYNFDPAKFKPEEIKQPRSRTFIPSRVTDNRYYRDTGYISVLQAMPEPLRSQMLYGDFDAGIEDDAYQVIPTKWVQAAMARWRDRPKKPEMLSIGVDCAMKGKDNTVIMRRHAGWWFDKPVVHPGRDCEDGPTTAGFVLTVKRDDAPIHVDVFGVGAQCYGSLESLQQQVLGINVGDPAGKTDRDSGKIPFGNLKAQLWWFLRELLDPARNTGIELPDDQQLLADLCAPRFKIKGQRLWLETREEIIVRLGRSPDWGSATVLACIDTMKRKVAIRMLRSGVPMPDEPQREHDPYRDL